MGKSKRITEAARKALENHGGKKAVLARALGVERQVVYNYLDGKVSDPKRDNVLALARESGYSVEWILWGKEIKQLTEAELKGRVPLISWVQAGTWGEAVDNFAIGDAEEFVNTAVYVGERAFALRARGDSMTSPTGKSIPDGSIVVIDPERAADNGSIVVAKLPGQNEVTLKQLVIDTPHRYLKPLNPEYRAIQTLKTPKILTNLGEKKSVYFAGHLRVLVYSCLHTSGERYE